jgi:hypothetical protein
MKIKALLEGIFTAIVSAILSYSALISLATFGALAVRQKFPDAWFSGLIVLYAKLAVLVLTAIIGLVAGNKVYRLTVRSSRR